MPRTDFKRKKKSNRSLPTKGSQYAPVYNVSQTPPILARYPPFPSFSVPLALPRGLHLLCQIKLRRPSHESALA